MAAVKFRELLRKHRRVAFDTSVFIYHFEANLQYVELTDEVFAWLARNGNRAVTSTITMTELMVQPYRDGGVSVVNPYYGIVSTIPHLEWIPVSLEIADLAAEIRANYGLKTPDAIQAATSLTSNVTAFVTNDAVFQRITGFETLRLDQFRADAGCG